MFYQVASRCDAQCRCMPTSQIKTQDLFLYITAYARVTSTWVFPTYILPFPRLGFSTIPLTMHLWTTRSSNVSQAVPHMGALRNLELEVLILSKCSLDQFNNVTSHEQCCLPSRKAFQTFLKLNARLDEESTLFTAHPRILLNQITFQLCPRMFLRFCRQSRGFDTLATVGSCDHVWQASVFV